MSRRAAKSKVLDNKEPQRVHLLTVIMFLLNTVYKPHTGIESASAEIKNHGYISPHLSLGNLPFLL